MKQNIEISKDGEILYKGKIANIKINEDAIIRKSIELFDDDEPCIIHQSYVIKEYANELVSLFKRVGTKELLFDDYEKELSFLQITNPKGVYIKLI